LEYDHTTYRTNNLENSTSLSLLLHHAFGWFTEYYTPTNALVIYYIFV
jgi:hypothetical protein